MKSRLFDFIVELQQAALQSQDNHTSQIKKFSHKQKNQLLDIIELADDFQNLGNQIAQREPSGNLSHLKYVANYQRIGTKLDRVLQKWGVKPIQFLHNRAQMGLCEVVETHYSDHHQDGEIITILKQGYQTETEILRMAQVITCKKNLIDGSP